jgi:hypothetical protein
MFCFYVYTRTSSSYSGTSAADTSAGTTITTYTSTTTNTILLLLSRSRQFTINTVGTSEFPCETLPHPQSSLWQWQSRPKSSPQAPFVTWWSYLPSCIWFIPKGKHHPTPSKYSRRMHRPRPYSQRHLQTVPKPSLSGILCSRRMFRTDRPLSHYLFQDKAPSRTLQCMLVSFRPYVKGGWK